MTSFPQTPQPTKALIDAIEERFSCGSWDDLDVRFLVSMARIAAASAEDAAPAERQLAWYRESRERRNAAVAAYKSDQAKKHEGGAA
jgi:hypothetical protein